MQRRFGARLGVAYLGRVKCNAKIFKSSTFHSRRFISSQTKIDPEIAARIQLGVHIIRNLGTQIVLATSISGGIIYYAHQITNNNERWLKFRKTVKKYSFNYLLPGNYVKHFWASLDSSTRTFISIAGLNTAVYLLWQLSSKSVRFTGFMSRYFSTSFILTSPVSILTSVFSHRGFLHLTINTWVIYTCIRSIHSDPRMGPSNFWAVFLTGGIVGSLSQNLFSFAVRSPRPALGASAGVYALLCSIATLYPDAKVACVFLPFLEGSIGYVLPAIICFDVLGLFWKNSPLGHAAHLGGALVGYLYSRWCVSNFNERNGIN